MSTDQPSIQNICDHRVASERLQLFNNLLAPEGVDPATATTYTQVQVLSLQYPVAALGSLNLYRQGLLVPTTGRYQVIADSSRTAPQGMSSKYVYIQLNSLDLSESILYEASYITSQQFCNKCNSTGYTDDLRQDGAGSPIRVTGTEQLAQDVEKFVRTELGSNRYHPWVGTQLNSLIGNKVVDQASFLSAVRSYIQIGLQNLKEAQIAHMNWNTKVTADEVLGVVHSIDVEADYADPTLFYVNVVYSSKSGRVLNYAGSVLTTG